MVPVALAVAAILAILSPAGGIWLVVPALVVVVFALRGGPITFARTMVAFVALIALLSVPTLAIARTFVGGASSAPVTQSSEVARLGHPLSTLQVLGIWPATDFRTSLHDPVATYVLMAVLVLCGVFGLVLALRMRAWSLPLFLATALGGVLLAFGLERLGLSSPWLNAKAMAEASPAIVAIGVAGALALFERGRRVEGSVACTAIAVGVLWSNGLAYSNVWLASRAQLVELESIGERYAGAGPTLITEHQPYGARHFLRAMDPEAASERRRRVVPLRGGGSLEDGDSADLDSFQLEAILVYKTLVQRTSPVASRPPSTYRLARAGALVRRLAERRRPARAHRAPEPGQPTRPCRRTELRRGASARGARAAGGRRSGDCFSARCADRPGRDAGIGAREVEARSRPAGDAGSARRRDAAL